jgi:hypothetical protein
MTTSFDKSKLKILLLEGIHPSAERIFRDAGYQNIETVKTALTGEELKSRLEGVHFLGIRSRTTLTRDIFEAADKLVAVGCYCIGTNQVDLTAATEHGVVVFNAPYSNTRSVAELVLAEGSLKKMPKHIVVVGPKPPMIPLRFEGKRWVSWAMVQSAHNSLFWLKGLGCASFFMMLYRNYRWVTLHKSRLWRPC